MDQNIMPFLTDELKMPCYLTAVGGEKDQQHVVRPDGYPNYHWLYCTKGSGFLVSGENKYRVCENMGFFLFPHAPHEYYALEHPWETKWVVFDGYGISGLMNLFGFTNAAPCYITIIHFINRLVNDIYVSAQSAKLNRGYKCSSLLYNLLVELKNCTANVPAGQRNSVTVPVQSAISFIEAHYNRDFTLDDLAAHIDISPQYLCRIFNQTLSMRPFEYLTKYRIQKSKELLISDYSFTVNTIAEKVGYHDPSYFCAKFRQQEGMTPLDFRKMYNSK